jgi:hypothetical protein
MIMSMGWNYVSELLPPIVHPPTWYMSMENHGGMISTGEDSWFVHQSSGNPTSSWLVAKEEELAKEILDFAVRIISFILRRVHWHTVKSYHMGLPALLLLRRKVCCGFLSPLKVYCSLPGLNPLTLGPVASTATTRPPRVTWRCHALLTTSVT